MRPHIFKRLPRYVLANAIRLRPFGSSLHGADLERLRIVLTACSGKGNDIALWWCWLCRSCPLVQGGGTDTSIIQTPAKVQVISRKSWKAELAIRHVHQRVVPCDLAEYYNDDILDRYAAENIRFSGGKPDGDNAVPNGRRGVRR